MAVVRNACLDALRSRRRRAIEDEFDEDDPRRAPSIDADTPRRPRCARRTRAGSARRSRALPVEYREVIVLRELEELSYKEISAIVKVPIGTVMSRLARGRDMLATRVRAEAKRRPG